MPLKTILGYDIVPGVSSEEYEKWLFEVHAPDLLANPYLDRIVFNKVLRPVTQASGGTARYHRATCSTGSRRCITPTKEPTTGIFSGFWITRSSRNGVRTDARSSSFMWLPRARR